MCLLAGGWKIKVSSIYNWKNSYIVGCLYKFITSIKCYAEKIMNKLLPYVAGKDLGAVELKFIDNASYLYKFPGFKDGVSEYYSIKWYN